MEENEIDALKSDTIKLIEVCKELYLFVLNVSNSMYACPHDREARRVLANINELIEKKD